MKKFDLQATSSEIRASQQFQDMMARLKYKIKVYGLTLKDEFED